jgi:hypothetical protein
MSLSKNVWFRSMVFGIVLAPLSLSFVSAQVSEADTPTGDINPGITTQPVQQFEPKAFPGETNRYYIPVPDHRSS